LEPVDGLCGVQDSLAPLYHAASVYDGGYGVLPGPAAMDFQPPYFPPPYPVPQAPAAATVAADFPLGASCPPAAPRVYYSGVQAGAGRPEPPSTSAVQPSDVGGGGGGGAAVFGVASPKRGAGAVGGGDFLANTMRTPAGGLHDVFPTTSMALPPEINFDGFTFTPASIGRVRPETNIRDECTGWAKKAGHRLVAAILSNLNRFLRFGRFIGKFVVKWILKIPPHLAFVATLRCETLMSAKQAVRQITTLHV